MKIKIKQSKNEKKYPTTIKPALVTTSNKQ